MRYAILMGHTCQISEPLKKLCMSRLRDNVWYILCLVYSVLGLIADTCQKGNKLRGAVVDGFEQMDKPLNKVCQCCA